VETAVKTSRKKYIIPITAMSIAGGILITILILFLVYADNRTLDYEDFIITTSQNISDMPVTIIHLSDLHFPSIRVDLEKMYQEIEAKEPDIIAITGDIISTRTTPIEESGVFEFIQRIVQIAPVFYVDGNHEHSNSNLFDYFRQNGVIILADESITVSVNGRNVTLIGMRYCYINGRDSRTAVIKGLSEDFEQNYIILLTHIPTFDNVLRAPCEQEIQPDLILAGHVHGGQMRIFSRGIFCPDTFLFPQYTSGIYKQGQTKMILSRGLGNSILPIRVNNKPHIPVIRIY